MPDRLAPHPVYRETVCSECGLDWDAHGPKPTLEDCVRLLKARLAMQPLPVETFRPWRTGTPMPLINFGGCAACAKSGICNCVRPTVTYSGAN